MIAVIINSIVRESEKAMLISLPVSWNGNVYAKEFWFPKSVVKDVAGNNILADDWFLNKLANSNTYHGYRMCFENC